MNSNPITFQYQPTTLQSLFDIVLHSTFSPLHYNHCLILFYIQLSARYITIIAWYGFEFHCQPITLHYHLNKLDKGRIITLSRHYQTMIRPLSLIGANNETGLADGFILHPLPLVVNNNKNNNPNPLLWIPLYELSLYNLIALYSYIIVISHYHHCESQYYWKQWWKCWQYSYTMGFKTWGYIGEVYIHNIYIRIIYIYIHDIYIHSIYI